MQLTLDQIGSQLEKSIELRGILKEFFKTSVSIIEINNVESKIIDCNDILSVDFETLIYESDSTTRRVKLGCMLSLVDVNSSFYDFEIYDVVDDLENSVISSKLSFDIDYWSYNIMYQQIADIEQENDFRKPDMQRNYVWDDGQASKLIESIIMGLPLPSIFLVKDLDKKYFIVDGYQRITTISSFILDKPLPNRSKPLKLTGVNKIINGMTAIDIKEQQPDLYKKLTRNTINIIEFKQNKPEFEEAMYYVFDRLNSGGTYLSSQQIRNSINYGYFNEKLNKFSTEKIAHYFSIKDQNKLTPSETILRVISIYKLVQKWNMKNFPLKSITTREKIHYKRLLDENAGEFHNQFKVAERKSRSDIYSFDNIKSNDSLDDFKKHIDELFENLDKSIEIVHGIFGNNSFKRFKNGKYKNTISQVLFESELVCLMLNHKKMNSILDVETIRNKFEKEIELNFDAYFIQATGSHQNIISRLNTMYNVFFG